MIESDGFVLLVDSGPDMRQQLLDADIKKVDALLWTHAHWDHYGGFPEFWRVQRTVDVYGMKPVLDHVLEQFHYIHHRRHEVLPYRCIEIVGIPITLFEVNHPTADPTCGLMIEGNKRNLVLSGDTVLEVPAASMELMHDADVLFVDAISPGRQIIKKHMNASQALELVDTLGPEQFFFYHVSHGYPPHQQAIREYPLSFDGMSIEF